jgi:hypothetical protein
VEQCGKFASDIEVPTKQRCVIEFFHSENITLVDIHKKLAERLWRPGGGECALAVATVVSDRQRSGQPCAAVSSRNEEHLDHLIRANLRITTRELDGFSTLETMLPTLECRKVYAS